jgi:putative ABC transport system permease protein
MSFVTRGAKNAFRNGLRTVSLVIILAVSTGLALTMLLARQAVETKIANVKGSIGNIITVSPAGSRGFSGGGNPLTETQVNSVKTLPHVVSVSESLTDQLTTTNSSLTSAITAGSLGQRHQSESGDSTSTTTPSGGGFGGFGGGSFTPPVSAIGSNNVNSLAALGGGTAKLTSGTTFDPTVDAEVALVGKTLATKNNLKVGSTFTAYGTTFTVKGIFDAGNQFSNNAVVMPLPTIQRLSSQTGDITSATVQVDSIDNLSATVTEIQNKLGSSADVVSQQDTANEALAPLANITSITLYSLIGAVVSGAAIIFLTMLMIVRERRREIGVYKAIGASNGKIVVQFVSEALVLTLLGSVVGMIAGALFSNSVVKVLVSSSTSSTTGGGPGGAVTRHAGGGFGGGFGHALGGGARALSDIHAAVGFSLILYGLAGAIIIAIVGSAIPAFAIAKVRPAEVMRGE